MGNDLLPYTKNSKFIFGVRFPWSFSYCSRLFSTTSDSCFLWVVQYILCDVMFMYWPRFFLVFRLQLLRQTLNLDSSTSQLQLTLWLRLFGWKPTGWKVVSLTTGFWWFTHRSLWCFMRGKMLVSTIWKTGFQSNLSWIYIIQVETFL